MTNIDTYMAEAREALAGYDQMEYTDNGVAPLTYDQTLQVIRLAMLKAARGIAEEAIGNGEWDGATFAQNTYWAGQSAQRTAQLARLDKIVGEG